MKQTLLDTNFILTCVKQKIDFFEYLENEGIRILIPTEVIKEVKGLKSKTALSLLEKKDFQKISLKGKSVDAGIINFAQENPKIIIATLDREIKNKIKNPKLIIRGRRKLEIL